MIDLKPVYIFPIRRAEVSHPGAEVWFPGTEVPFTRTEVPFTRTEAPFTRTEVPFTRTEVPFTRTEAPFPCIEIPFYELGKNLNRFLVKLANFVARVRLLARTLLNFHPAGVVA
jgi:hypothetical protein